MEGIEVRETGKGPRYRGTAWDARNNRRLKGPWGSHREATAWRRSILSDIERSGTVESVTVRAAAIEFKAGIRDGSIRSRSGRQYKPSTVRGYERALDLFETDYGARTLSSLKVPEMQRMVDALVRDGVDPSTLHRHITGLRAMVAWASTRGFIEHDPFKGLRKPSPESRRDRIATPVQAAAMIDAAGDPDLRLMLALAFWAGLRAGEIMGLCWDDFDGDRLHVRRSVDHATCTLIEPKSRAAVRAVPVIDNLAALLESGDGLLFPQAAAPARPRSYRSMVKRLDHRLEGWDGERFGLHEARHTFASILIAARVNPKVLSEIVGHADIQTTFNVYGHLMPGDLSDARARVNAYLKGSPIL